MSADTERLTGRRASGNVRWVKRVLVGAAVVSLLVVGIVLSRSDDGDSGSGEYCAALGVIAGGGATDSQGRPLEEFDEADKRRTYLRIAELAPEAHAADWRVIANGFTDPAESGDEMTAEFEAQERARAHARAACGLRLETL
jgi:hypothetical protein